MVFVLHKITYNFICLLATYLTFLIQGASALWVTNHILMISVGKHHPQILVSTNGAIPCQFHTHKESVVQETDDVMPSILIVYSHVVDTVIICKRKIYHM